MLELNGALGDLDLSSNKLSGEIPQWISDMPYIYYVNLSNNAFESRLPVGLFKNTGMLVKLNLSNNRFTGGIDEDIGEWPAMPRIEYFDVPNNPLGGVVPESMRKMKRLREVRMARSGLTGQIPEDCWTWGGLLCLTCQITGYLVQYRITMPVLRPRGSGGIRDFVGSHCHRASCMVDFSL
ncbi:uncharacterized protein A4U43_C04F4750 [Asparagus officinalis]|uniref:Leucine-rich repeat-containing N-terminal plant-type domain-containing protein n=1 Tax=Asparagus officinalis TaxID=4686 RepID=A0A5P1F045_ASPOF|nr:MDIS1-interacting receptor like kinase 2-like [Asparagus officinalis]ONK71103.1 uncharacterized protein A4U43_C04F4750 [Asparagus officinalis]